MAAAAQPSWWVKLGYALDVLLQTFCSGPLNLIYGIPRTCDVRFGRFKTTFSAVIGANIDRNGRTRWTARALGWLFSNPNHCAQAWANER